MSAQVLDFPQQDKGTLRCTSCHATVDSPCDCGASFDYMPPRKLAEAAVARVLLTN